jgi:hypothetical protein
MDRESPTVPRDATTYELIISALFTRYQQSQSLSSLVLDDDDDESSESDSDLSIFQMSKESMHEYERDFMEIYQLAFRNGYFIPWVGNSKVVDVSKFPPAVACCAIRGIFNMIKNNRLPTFNLNIIVEPEIELSTTDNNDNSEDEEAVKIAAAEVEEKKRKKFLESDKTNQYYLLKDDIPVPAINYNLNKKFVESDDTYSSMSSVIQSTSSISAQEIMDNENSRYSAQISLAATPVESTLQHYLNFLFKDIYHSDNVERKRIENRTRLIISKEVLEDWKMFVNTGTRMVPLGLSYKEWKFGTE